MPFVVSQTPGNSNFSNVLNHTGSQKARPMWQEAAVLYIVFYISRQDFWFTGPQVSGPFALIWFMFLLRKNAKYHITLSNSIYMRQINCYKKHCTFSQKKTLKNLTKWHTMFVFRRISTLSLMPQSHSPCSSVLFYWSIRIIAQLLTASWRTIQ